MHCKLDSASLKDVYRIEIGLSLIHAMYLEEEEEEEEEEQQQRRLSPV
jgi:hypothetical protein